MENHKRNGIICYIAAAVFDIAAVVSFFTRDSSSMGIMWLCLGSAFLCFGSSHMAKARTEDKKDPEDGEK